MTPRAGRLAAQVVCVSMLCAAALGSAPATAEDAPSGDAARGKLVYARGVSPSGDPLRAIVVGSIDVPAEQHACAQCHGTEGRGGEQGGILVPDIRSDRLRAPYGVPTLLGGVRPPYDDAALERAIQGGVHSGGQPLDEVMPRYVISDRDLRDLIAYLHRLGTEAPPGVYPDRIRVGALLPLTGPRASTGRPVAKLLERYFERLSGGVGIDGRRVDLVVRDVGSPGADPTAIARALVAGDDPVLCLVAVGGSALSPSVSEVLRTARVPVVGPLTLAPSKLDDTGTVFYLLSSLADQGRATARHAAGAGGLALIWAEDARSREMADGLSSELALAGRAPLLAESWDGADPTALAARLRASTAARVVLLMRAAWAQRLIDGVGDAPAIEEWVVSSVLLGGAVRAVPRRLAVVSPGVAPGSAGDMVRLRDLLGLDDASARELEHPMPMTAFAAAEALTVALLRSGQDLSRGRIVQSLADIRSLHTGVMPPISYGRARRVAARGALVVGYDGTGARTEARWIDLDRP